MKIKHFLAAGFLALLVACETPYRATDTTVVVAPDGTQTAFITRYPGATNIVWSHYDESLFSPIDWELAGWPSVNQRDYVVKFKMDNEDYYAYYDEDGEWIGTAYVMSDITTIPSVVSNTVNNQFPGYTINAVSREFRNDQVVYEVEMKNADSKIKLLVDGNGTILKQKTKST